MASRSLIYIGDQLITVGLAFVLVGVGAIAVFNLGDELVVFGISASVVGAAIMLLAFLLSM